MSSWKRYLPSAFAVLLPSAFANPCCAQGIQTFSFTVFFSHVVPGLTLKGDEDGCGCVVKSVLKGGAVGLDGRVGVGDHIVAVNDESMIGLSGHRAR